MKKIISTILALSLVLTFCAFGTSCQKELELTNSISKNNIKDYLGFEVTYSDFNLTKGKQISSTIIFYEYIIKHFFGFVNGFIQVEDGRIKRKKSAPRSNTRGRFFG